MKHLFTAIFLFFAIKTQARLLDVPEGCFDRKKSPCLIQVQENDEVIKIKGVAFRAQKGSILNVLSFEGAALDIIKGRLHFKELSEPVTLNEIVIQDGGWLIERDQAILSILNLKNFLFSTYNIFEISSQNVLAHSSFLEKGQFVQFTAGFFATRSQFKEFAKSIEIPWKKELQKHSEHQKQVITRSLAMATASEKEQKLKEERQRHELKKIREEFFYRTFYR